MDIVTFVDSYLGAVFLIGLLLQMPDLGSVRAKQQLMLLRIIAGDCQLLRALLTFTKMTIPSYVKGGILLRSASKVYKKIFKELEKLDEGQKTVNGGASPGAPVSYFSLAATAYYGNSLESESFTS